ncbi:MAG TPA: DUF6542 domain-containing protein [Pseudonocardiaceae bacterium]
MSTTSRERPATGRGLAWGELSLLPERPGLPWWAAVVVALVLTAVGAFADMERSNRLGIVFQVCYFLGCVLAVAAVQRKGLFGPMVQPPLILAGMVPVVVLLTGSLPNGGGTTAAALVVGTPLINGFPTMAITTLATVGIGAYRLLTQRPLKDAAQAQRDQSERDQAETPKARQEPPRDRPRPTPRPAGEPAGKAAAQDATSRSAPRDTRRNAPRDNAAAPRRRRRRAEP